MSESNQENVTETKSTNGMNTERREVLKGLATIPVVGVFFYNLWRKLRIDEMKRKNLLADLITTKDAPAVISSTSSGSHLRIGIIGYGVVGKAVSHTLSKK